MRGGACVRISISLHLPNVQLSSTPASLATVLLFLLLSQLVQLAFSLNTPTEQAGKRCGLTERYILCLERIDGKAIKGELNAS